MNINLKGKVSEEFIKIGISDFYDAFNYVKKLSYGRISNRKDPTLVLTEKKGTCSSKHNLLALLAEENDFDKVRLMLCIFKMNTDNVYGSKEILQKYDLDFIPEAHNFLLINNKVFDATWESMPARTPTDDILVSKPVEVNWNIKYKEQYHKNYINHHSANWKYSTNQLWDIRSDIIESLML